MSQLVSKNTCEREICTDASMQTPDCTCRPRLSLSDIPDHSVCRAMAWYQAESEAVQERINKAEAQKVIVFIDGMCIDKDSTHTIAVKEPNTLVQPLAG